MFIGKEVLFYSSAILKHTGTKSSISDISGVHVVIQIDIQKWCSSSHNFSELCWY